MRFEQRSHPQNPTSAHRQTLIMRIRFQHHWLFICLAAVLSCNTAAADEKGESSGDWKPLFNGKNLDGWKVQSGTATYRVEDGTIVGTTSPGSPNTFLASQETFADFELTFEVLLEDNELNSGVQIRSKLRDGQYGGVTYGPQVEIAAGPSTSGFIYGESAGGWQSPEPESADPTVNKHDHFQNKAWNKYRVLAVGRHIQTWINDQPIADLQYDPKRYEDNSEGFIGLQVHGVGDSGPYHVRWRNIQIRPIVSEKK